MIKNKARVSASSHFNSTLTGGSSKFNKRQKKKKYIYVGKEEIKLSLFADNIILGNNKESATTTKSLYWINDYSSLSLYTLACSVCLTLCNPVDCNPPGSSVWVAMPSSTGSSWPKDQTWVSCIAGRFTAKPSGRPSLSGYKIKIQNHLLSCIPSRNNWEIKKTLCPLN